MRINIGPRFGLRTMLAVMLIAAIFFAWFGWRLRKSQRQTHAVAVLQELGAIYTYDFQAFEYERPGPAGRMMRSVKPLAATGKSPYSRRLQTGLGIDFLHNITRVHLETSYRLADDDIDRLWSALGELPDLEYLEASGPVTRAGAIQRLKAPRKLKRLAIRWGRIADDDLTILARLPRLEDLNLNETPITDAAMVHVGRAHKIESLELHHTKITDAGLRDLAKLANLRRLRLSATAVGDAGMRRLRGLNRLHELDLTHTKISDDALGDIASLENLHKLDLSMTAVTDHGLAHLARLQHLRSLKLEAMTAVSDVLAVIPRLPSLEELHGPPLTGDLSRISQCPKLRILHSGFPFLLSEKQRLQLPPTLEEISGLPLTDETIDSLAALENLRIVHAVNPYLQDAETLAEGQRLRAKLRAALPGVTIADSRY